MGISAQRIPTAKANPTLPALKVSQRASAGHRIVIAAATGAVIVEAAADAGADAADAMAAVIAGAAAAVVAIATRAFSELVYPSCFSLSHMPASRSVTHAYRVPRLDALRQTTSGCILVQPNF